MKEKKEALQGVQENRPEGDKVETHAYPQQQNKDSPAEIELLQKELNEKQEAINDYINHLKRLQADFENYIKRAEKERQEFQEFANHKFILSLLSIKDEFEIALKAIKADENVYKGVSMIFSSLKKALEEQGVKEITVKGTLFDPYLHEAVSFIKSQEHPENAIVEELQKGYTMKGRVLRFSKVKVAKNAADAVSKDNISEDKEE